MKFLKFTKLFLATFFTCSTLFSFTPTNFFSPYDINYRMSDWINTNVKVGVNVEHGQTSKGRNGNEDKVNVLQIYNKGSESSLAMLLGAERNSEIYNLANNFLAAYGPALDDGVRGHFKLKGDYEQTDIDLWATYRLPLSRTPGNFDLCFYLPIKILNVKDVRMHDLTQNVLSADRDVHFYLTDNLKEFAKTYGDLDLGSWKKTGISDIVLLLKWSKDFRQMKEHLKNVGLFARTGVSMPTGKQKDENDAFSLPMGNDGAWAIPFTAGLDLNFVHKINAGLEFEMLFSFDKSKLRRLKTDRNQTEYFLLSKGYATKSPGFAWKFNLYAQAERFVGGLSATVAYQFFRHDSDTLSAESNDFSYKIINSAENLQEWGYQNFVFKLNYDFFKEFTILKPQISLFYKYPVAGKRVINPHTFGGQLAFNF